MKKRKNQATIQWAGIGMLVLTLAACASTTDAPPHVSAFAPRGPEQVFAAPELAVTALADANRHNDKTALLKILGPNGAKIISSGDPVADKEGRARFVSAYDTAHKLEPVDDVKETLVVGDEEWPLPIPLVRVGDKAWQFDTEAGEQEILNRRIGHNEITAIKTARVYVEAQHDYAALHSTPDGVEYAQRFVSRPGKHDGLYWPAKAGEAESPFGPLIAEADAEGYAAGKHHHKPEPYHGYYYKILKQQSANAAGGAKSYIKNGRMSEGFALVAFPAKYGDSGVMSFIVNQSGIVFEKNLGPDTRKIAFGMTAYDPDASWNIAKER